MKVVICLVAIKWIIKTLYVVKISIETLPFEISPGISKASFVFIGIAGGSSSGVEQIILEFYKKENNNNHYYY